MRPKSEAWIPKLGFRGHGCDEASLEVLMRPKSEAWIPKLGFRGRGCYATKPDWRFDAAEIRSLDSDAWIPWNVDATKVALRF